MSAARRTVVRHLAVPYGQGGRFAQVVRQTQRALWQAFADDAEVVRRVMADQACEAFEAKVRELVAGSGRGTYTPSTLYI